MLRRLFRQRRRLAWAALCLTLAAIFRMGPVPGVLAAPVIAAGLGAALLAFLPQSRAWVESVGLGCVVTALLPVPTIALPFIIPAASWLAYLALYGTWWDATRVRLGLISRQSAALHGTPAQLWSRLVPGEGHPDDHWSGTLLDFDTDPDDALTVYLRHSNADALPEEMTLSFLEKEAPLRCRYLLERQTDGHSDEAELSLVLTGAGGQTTTAISTLRHMALSPRLAVMRWLDDALGDEWDSLTATLSRKRDWSITGIGRADRHAAPASTIGWPEAWPAPPRAHKGPLQTGSISPSARNA